MPIPGRLDGSCFVVAREEESDVARGPLNLEMMARNLHDVGYARLDRPAQLQQVLQELRVEPVGRVPHQHVGVEQVPAFAGTDACAAASPRLDQALGGAFPAAHLLRAISVGDRETAIRLGGLSLVGEDLVLADYVTGAEPRFSAQLTGLLASIAAEEAA